MNQALDLLDQIIVVAQAQAKDLDDYNLMRHKALKTVGKNALVHNLEMLRELLDKEQETKPSTTITLAGKDYVLALGDNQFRSPGLPEWADKLPKVLDIGKRAKITGGYAGKGSWIGREGVITQHYVNGDDCGDWGKLYYGMIDDNGVYFYARCEYCTLC